MKEIEPTESGFDRTIEINISNKENNNTNPPSNSPTTHPTLESIGRIANEIIKNTSLLLKFGDVIMKETMEDKINSIHTTVIGLMEQNHAILSSINRLNQYLVSHTETTAQFGDSINMHIKFIKGINENMTKWSNTIQEIQKLLESSHNAKQK